MTTKKKTLVFFQFLRESVSKKKKKLGIYKHLHIKRPYIVLDDE